MPEPTLCCRNCGANLEHIDTSQEFVTCPYCGGLNQVADLLGDSDPVRIEKIRARTRAKVESMRLDAETEELERAKEEDMRFGEAGRKRAYRVALTLALLAAALACVAACYESWQMESYLASGIAGFQSLLCLVSAWLCGTGCKGRMLAAVLLCLLLCPLWYMAGTDPELNGKNARVWENISFPQVLPEPENGNLRVLEDREDWLLLQLKNQKQRQFEAYLESCRESGFDIEAEFREGFYQAGNAQGYQLKLSYDPEEKLTEVRVTAPRELGVLVWPEGPLGDRIPRPDSQVGKLRWSYPDNFSLSVGEMSRQAFESYCRDLETLGYDQDLEQTDNRFSARNRDGVLVEVNYEGSNTVNIYLRLPEVNP